MNYFLWYTWMGRSWENLDDRPGKGSKSHYKSNAIQAISIPDYPTLQRFQCPYSQTSLYSHYDPEPA